MISDRRRCSLTGRRSQVDNPNLFPTQQEAHSQLSHLQTVQIVIEQYLPYLLALCAATEGRDVDGERAIVQNVQPFVVEWRTTISSTIAGKEAPRVRINGIYGELAFTF